MHGEGLLMAKDIEVSFSPMEDPNEEYLYMESESAVSCLSVLPFIPYEEEPEIKTTDAAASNV